MKVKNAWYVYLVRCSDNSLYCGITTDIARRIEEHNNGAGSKYVKGRRPCHLVLHSFGMVKSTALKLEYWIKSCPTNKKIEVFQKWLKLFN